MIDQEKLSFYFLAYDFGENWAGLEKALLSRANLFNLFLNIYPTILTSQYNPRLNIQREKLYMGGVLDKRSTILNLYEYFQDYAHYQLKVPKEDHNNNERLSFNRVEGTNDERVCNNTNQLVFYRKCDNDGILMYNNIFVNKKKVRKDTFDYDGYLSRSQYFNKEKGYTEFEIYYRRNGLPCIYKYYEFKNEKSLLTQIQLMNETGEIIATFSTETDFVAHWLKLIFTDDNKHFLIIDKERIYFPALLKLDLNNIFIVCMIHASHLMNKKQDLIKGLLNSNYRLIFENQTRPDAVVVFTKLQKQHILNRFNLMEDRLYAIPHSTTRIQPVDFDTRLPKTIIYLARYSKDKGFERLLRIFHKVLQVHPDAYLELYGSGGYRDIIIKDIQDLGITKNVNAHFYADDTDKIYDSATLAVCPSRTEAFSLFVLESISHGCPIISFNIDYGPSDMINHGYNGYLIENDDEEVMAQKIIELLNDKEKLKTMSENSYKMAELFKSEQIAAKWIELIETVITKHADLQD